MATRSPGIYYKEIDNTQFTNPESVSGTTLAIVGYATKGPEGIPTEINSWQKFLEIFGKPVKGMYSGLAVKNYLQAGGTVLFTRVLDETATPSNYVVKNGKKAVDASATFNHKGDVLQGTLGFNPGSVYSFKVTTTPETSKNILIRTIKNKKLSQASIIQQIDNQLKDNQGTYEWKLEEGYKDKLYQFKENSKDYFLSTTSLDNEESFANKLGLVLNNPNGTTAIPISSTRDAKETEDVDNDFGPLTGKKSFVLNTIQYTIDVEDATDAQSIVKKINDAIKETNVRAIFKNGNNGTIYNNIIFVNTAGTKAPVVTTDSLGKEALFLNRSKVTNDEFTKTSELEENEGIYITDTVTKTAGVSPENPFTVVYDENSGDIIVKAKTVDAFTDIKESEKYEGLTSLASKNHILITNSKAITDVNVFKDAINNTVKLTHKNSISIEYDGASFSTYKTLDFVSLMDDVTAKPSTGEILDGSRDMIEFTSKEKGSGTSDIAIEVTSIINPLDPNEQTKYLKVYSNGMLKESFDDISLLRNDKEKRFDTIMNESKENGGSAYVSVKITENINEEFANSIELPDGVWKLGQSNKDGDEDNYRLGTDGVAEDVLTAEEIFGKVLDYKDSLLANKDLYDFHIIISPDAFNIDTVQNACIKLCETRGDAIAIVDPPMGLDKKAVIDWHNGSGRGTALDSNYAAVYWPWCKVLDTSSGTGKFAWVMPSVVMASQYVRVDISSGAQAAPAGELNGRIPVIDIQSYPNEADRDELYVNYNRINPIVKFKDGSVVVYGEKTTQRKETVLTKIHTRRMLVQIKKQCRGALRRYLFMPNTTDYLGKISNDVTSILEAYKANGGLNFYKVICDETNNSVETRQQDIINVDAILVPQGTIEQINISLTLNKTAETVTD